MPRTANPPAEATVPVFVAIESFACEDPNTRLPFICKRGTRIAGDHWVVSRYPMWFIKDGATDAEVHAKRAESYGFLTNPPAERAAA